jgi:hypothetical protein
MMAYTKEQGKRILIGAAALIAIGIWISPADKNTNASSNKTQSQPTPHAMDKNLTTTLKIKGNSVDCLIAGDAGQSINFGDDENLDCSATWQLDRLDPHAENALIKKTKRKEDNTFFIECYFQDQHFVQSSKHDTLAEIIITDNKPEDKTASFIVKFELFNTSSDNPKMLSIGYQKINVTPEQYELIF